MTNAATTPETKRLPGRRFVVPFVLVLAAVAAVCLAVQFSGRGANARNYLLLSYGAGLRDLDDGFYLDAVKNLTPVVESAAEPAAFGFRGEAYLRMKRYAEAEADFRKAVEAEPDLPANHAGLGAALAGQGRHAEAVERFDAALARFPNAPPAGAVPRTGASPAEVERLRAASAAAKG